MTRWWLGAVGLIGVVVLVAWPAWRRRRRRRAVIGGRHAVRTGPGDGRGAGAVDRSEGADRAGRARWWRRPDRLLAALPPWRAVLVVVVLAGAGAAFAGGPVAAFAVAVYSGLAVRGMLRHRAGRLAERAYRRQLDELCALAADLRAGLPPSVAMLAVDGSDRLAGLARAAVRLAEQTGAPLADLVERIEADARAMDRGLAAAEAQAAGARATAWLLAGLPLGGIALGYGIGVDPLRILLYTPIGAACAIGAITLQLAGLAWAARLNAAGRTAGLGAFAAQADGIGPNATWAG